MRRTGSIIQRGPNSWQLKFDLPNGPDAKRQTRRETVHAASRAEAQKILNGKLAERDNGSLVAPNTITVAKAVEDAIAEARYVAKFDTRAREILALHIAPYFGHRKLQSLTPNDIARWQLALQEKRHRGRPLSSATLIQISKVLRRALRRATGLGLLVRNPALQVALPKTERRVMTILTKDELRSLVEKLAADRRPSIARLALLTLCAAFSGARLGEILAMRWQDLDLTAGRWGLQHSFEVVGGELVLRPCKTEASRRVLNLGPALIALLTAHKTAQAERRLAQGHRVAPSDWVFDDGRGGPLNPNTISSHWGKAMQRLDFSPRIKFHALRHLYASYALEGGRSLPEIKDELGHSLVQTTLTLYAHRLPNAGRVAASVEAMLWHGKSRA